MARSSNPYGDFGSVPNKVEVSGSGARPFSVRADAADFGADIGQGLQKLGATGVAVGAQFAEQQQREAEKQAAELKKQQDALNETIASEAEIKYVSDIAGLGAEYESLSGLDAYAALPKYTQGVAALRKQYAEQLPESVRPVFDTLARRHELAAMRDATKYGVTQLKKAEYDSAAKSIAMAQTNAGYTPIANDDYRFGETLGDIHANIARQFKDYPGIVEDKETGQFIFEDSETGKKAEAEYKKTLDSATGQAWQNRFQTLANQNPIEAYQKYQSEKEEIPPQFQIALDAFFYPRVRDAEASGVTGNVLQKAEVGYSEAYAKTGKPNPVAVVMKNELHGDGVIRIHADGDGQAIGGINSNGFPEQFAEASDILRNQGQVAARKYIENFYQKEIIEKNGIQNLPANVQEIVADGVTNHRGEIQKQLVDAAKNGASPQDLIAIRRAEYDRLVTENPAKYGQYKDAWNKRLDGFGYNEGAIRPPTTADYYKENYEFILENARRAAQDQRPGDSKFAELAEQKTKNHLDDVIRQQTTQYTAASKKLYQASVGALTKGERPTSMDAIKAISPEMKSLVEDVMMNQPQVYNTIDRQIRVAGNARSPKIPVDEQNRVYTEIFDEVAQWQLSTKKGKPVVGNKDKKQTIEDGSTSGLEDLIRIQNRITDEANRGVKGLRSLMNKVTPAILDLVAKEQGSDDAGWDWGGEQLEPYDDGYQVIQNYLQKQNKETDLPLKAKMLSGFVRMADAIPAEIQKNPVEYKKALAATADFVITDVVNNKVPATRNLPDAPNFAYKDGELVEGLPGKRNLKPDTKINDLEVKMQVDANGNKAKVYFRDGKKVKAEILDKDGNVAKEVLF
jgi:hypothetical protein